MEDGTIAEIEKWLRELAHSPNPHDAGGGAAEPPDPARDQERPYWPYLDTEDFWRE